MTPFNLEDFFDEYEHLPGLVNLASSDALPWTPTDLCRSGGILAEVASTFAYPDVKGHLIPGLKALCRPPDGTGLLPTAGAAEGIALVLHEHWDWHKTRATCLVGLPMPGYGAFQGLTSLLGLPSKTYIYHPGRAWAPNFDELLALSRQCTALVVVRPHNPTGHVIPMEFLGTLAKELGSRGATLIVDEVFRVPGKEESAIGLDDHVVVVGSLSKTYGLPGVRLGWVAANKDRLGRLRTLQQYFTLTLNTLTVAVGAALLKDPERFSRTDLICKNRSIVREWAKTLEGHLSISEPQGGTTVCLNIKTTLAETPLFERLRNAGVLLAPGSRCFEFSPESIRWFRLSYGTDARGLIRGLEIIKEVADSVARG
jgi:aspartate/methionine/tyrosine aminotransferase